ncbi:MAG: ubiquinone/menaquinone biosynthesis methyltransferase [Fidelibacterota bacterium]
MSKNSTVKDDREPHYRGSFLMETKEDMAAMFRQIHGSYDVLNHLFSFGNDVRWRRKSAALLRFRKADRILDFGAGTGDFATAVRRSANVQVAALDLVPEMMKRLLQKRDGNDLSWVTLIVGDGERLPFADETFDGVVAGFVGRNLFSLKGGLREMSRVLKTGGRVGFLEFCRPTNPVIKAVTWLYFRTIVSLLGNLFAPKDLPAYSYLIHSIEEFLGPDELAQIFREVGFRKVRTKMFNLETVALTMGEK